jgi:hypothetical protein
MRATTLLAATVLLALLGWLVARWYWAGDEQAIRVALDELATSVSEPAGEGVEALARAARLGQFFAPDVVVDLGQPFPVITDRDTLMAMAANAHVPGQELEVRFVDVEVKVLPGGAEAVVHLTVTAAGTGRSFDRGLDARELEMGWRKRGGTWEIARVTGVETLERPR